MGGKCTLVLLIQFVPLLLCLLFFFSSLLFYPTLPPPLLFSTSSPTPLISVSVFDPRSWFDLLRILFCRLSVLNGCDFFSYFLGRGWNKPVLPFPSSSPPTWSFSFQFFKKMCSHYPLCLLVNTRHPRQKKWFMCFSCFPWKLFFRGHFSHGPPSSAPSLQTYFISGLFLAGTTFRNQYLREHLMGEIFSLQNYMSDKFNDFGLRTFKFITQALL